MADPVTPPVSDPPADPPVTPPADPPADPVTPPADPKDEWDYDRGMATITKLRDEVKAAKAAAKENADAVAKLKTIEDAQLSEHDKLEKRVTEYEQREAVWAAEKKETALKLGVFSLQATLGVADTDLALAALDRSQVEYDDTGQPTNLQDVLTALLEAKPLLKGVTVPPASGSLNAGAGAQTGPPLKLSAEQLEAAQQLGMTAESYAAMGNVKTYEDWQKAQAARNPA